MKVSTSNLCRLEPDLSAGPTGVSVPTIKHSGGWSDLYRGERKSALEDALLGYIKSQRWFAGKARQIRSSETRDAVTPLKGVLPIMETREMPARASSIKKKAEE